MIEARFQLMLEDFPIPSSVTEVRQPKTAPVAPPCVPEWPVPELERRTFHLYEIPACELAQMCEDFKMAVFKRAGKESFLLSGEKQHPVEAPAQANKSEPDQLFGWLADNLEK